MRRTLALLIPVVLLAACATQPQAPSHGPADGGPPPGKAVAAATATPAAAATPDPALEKTLRSSVSVCYDAALKLCRDRDYRIRAQQKGVDQTAYVTAQGRSFEFTLAFARATDSRTRASVRVQGRAMSENREEARSLLNLLCDALLEPRD